MKDYAAQWLLSHVRNLHVFAPADTPLTAHRNKRQKYKTLPPPTFRLFPSLHQQAPTTTFSVSIPFPFEQRHSARNERNVKEHVTTFRGGVAILFAISCQYR